MIDKDSLPLDKPRRTPDHPTKSHVVKTRVDGKEKVIRFGEQGASTAGKPKEGESERMKAKRASFKSRHAKNIAKGKSSPAYWANKVKWATGGSVGLEDLEEKYEGIKKPDFKMLDSFKDLVRTLQSRAEDAGDQEFDAVRALGRTGAAGSLEDLYAAYADKPKGGHARRAEAGAADPDRAKTAKMVFDSFKSAGFSDAQAKALTAEINREGSLNPAYLYGTHTDAANRATNVGMLSWQGDRANRLMSFMADRGLIDPSGSIAPGQDALNAQAEYLRWEMENDPSYAKTRETFLGNPNIDQETAHDVLGKNFIRWRIDDPQYRDSGFNRIYEGYNLLNTAQGYKEGGKVKADEDELERAIRLRDLELMAEPRNPEAVPAQEPSLLNVGGIGDRLALINQTLNPVEAIGGAMRAGSDLMAPGAGGYDRLEALGRMLSGVAGVAGPAAVAKRVGAPAANAVMDALVGGSPTTEALADMGRKYAVDESGALPGAGPGKGAKAIRAYHSSPFDFDRFDRAHLDSAPGYGAQFYGQGFYFSPLKRVSGRGNFYWKHFLKHRTTGPESVAAEAMLKNKFDREKAAEQMRRRISSRGYEPQPGEKDWEKIALEMIESGQIVGPRTYEVEINANPDDFFNFDKPLSEQSPAVREVFSSLGTPEEITNLTGDEAWKNLLEKNGYVYDPKGYHDNLVNELKAGRKNTALLREAGVPGAIAGDMYPEDTYVVFDENLINIVRKYGIAGAAAALGVSQAEVAQAMGQGNVEELDQKYAGGGFIQEDRTDLPRIYSREPTVAESVEDWWADKIRRVSGDTPFPLDERDSQRLAKRVANLLSYVPISAGMMSGAQAERDIEAGDYGSAALNAGTALLDVVPLAAATKGGASAIKAAADDVTELAAKYMSPDDIARFVADEAGSLPGMGIGLPEPRTEAEDIAREILQLRAEGRAKDVTEEMMDAADPQYMYYNTPLPMGAESRMARAEGMGHDTSLPLYHGTESGDIRSFRLDPRTNEFAVYSAKDPSYANEFAGVMPGERAPLKEGSSVIPLLSRGEHGDLTMAGGVLDRTDVPNIAEMFGIDPRELLASWDEIAAEGLGPNADVLPTYAFVEQSPLFKERLEDIGMKGVDFLDYVTRGPNEERLPWNRATLDPANLRSRFARFDPEFAHLRNLSAGVAAGAIGASQYDPDAIETTAARVRENKFASGGIVRYDPAAVDSIINKLREVNRG